MKSTKKTIYLFTYLITLLNLTSCSYGKTTITLGLVFDSTWPFSNENSYDYDENLVEVVNGKAQLKPLDLEHSGDDLNNGTHVGTYVSSNENLKVLTQPKIEDIHVNQVFPSKSSNLVGYWRFENNYNDESLLQQSLTPTGTVSISTNSKFGKASLNLDSSGGAIAVEPPEPRHAFTSGTISAWIKPGNAVAGFKGIVVKQHAYGLFLNNNILVTYDWGTGSIRSTGITLNDDSWYHVLLVVDSGTASGSKVYLNGVKVLDTTVTVVHQNDGIVVGSGDSPPTIQFFNGKVDEVSIWDTPLTDGEVLELYNFQNTNYTELSSSWTPKWDNIVGYWKMDGNWQDSSGNGHHGLRNGTGDSSPEFSIDNKVGSHGGAFDSVNDDVSIPDNTDFQFGLGDFSIAAWVKTSAGGAIKIAIGKFNGVISNYWLGIEAGGTAALNLVGSSVKSNTIIIDSTWHHVVGVRRNGITYMYIDGNLENSSPGAADATALGELRLGSFGSAGSFKWDGLIDEASIWSVGLAADEVKLIYNRQKQKYAGHYDSEVIDIGNSTAAWPDLSWSTSLPFGKELTGDFDNDGSPESESSSDYYGLSGSLSSGLVGYWNFNESLYDSGPGASDFADASISNGHGNEVGGAIIGQNGYFNKAVFLDGIDDYIDFSDNATVPSGLNSTVSFWFKTNRMSVTQRLGQYGVKTGCSPSSMIYQLNLDGAIQLFVGCGGNVASNPGLVKAGQWHHFLSFTSSSGETSVYINGDEAIPPTDIRSGQTLGNGFFVLGTVFAGGVPALFTQGHYDEVGIWDRVLSIDEIQQLYRRGANRVKLQVKSCVDSSCNCKSYGAGGSETDCDGDSILNTVDSDDSHKSEFIGPGGDGTTYFSELYNRTTTDVTFNCALNTSDSNPGVCVEDEITLTGSSKPSGPEFLNIDYTQFINPSPNRYAQYRVYMEADDNTACGGEPCLPELSSVSLNPQNSILYPSEYAEVKPSTPINFTKLYSMTIEADTCAMFRLARAGTEYYYDSGTWKPVATDTDRSPASDLENHILQFETQFGAGPLEVIGYLKSNASQSAQCRIDDIDIRYK